MFHVIHFQIDYANKFTIYENYLLLQEEKENHSVGFKIFFKLLSFSKVQIIRK